MALFYDRLLPGKSFKTEVIIYGKGIATCQREKSHLGLAEEQALFYSLDKVIDLVYTYISNKKTMSQIAKQFNYRQKSQREFLGFCEPGAIPFGFFVCN